MRKIEVEMSPEPGTVWYYDTRLFAVLEDGCQGCVFADSLVYGLSGAVFNGQLPESEAVAVLEDLNEDCAAGLLSPERCQADVHAFVGALIRNVVYEANTQQQASA